MFSYHEIGAKLEIFTSLPSPTMIETNDKSVNCHHPYDIASIASRHNIMASENPYSNLFDIRINKSELAIPANSNLPPFIGLSYL